MTIHAVLTLANDEENIAQITHIHMSLPLSNEMFKLDDSELR